MYRKRIMMSIIGILLLASCSQPTKSGPQMPPFSYTNQHGETFGLEQVEGKIWIASFIFTTCQTVCIPMTQELVQLQKLLKKEEQDVEFVIFTVDPTNDTPEKLTAYLKQFTDDDSNWNLLTGYTQEEIETLAMTTFKTIVQKPSTSKQVIHGTNFYLFDKEGFLIGEYNYVDESYETQILQAVKKANQQPDKQS